MEMHVLSLSLKPSSSGRVKKEIKVRILSASTHFAANAIKPCLLLSQVMH